MGKFGYNTAISSLMECANVWKQEGESLSKGDAMRLIKLFAPIVPYMSEEIWENLGGKLSIHNEMWPEYDKNLIKEDEVIVVVQVNGKLRGQIEVDRGVSEDKDKMIKLAKKNEGVKKFIEGKKIVKEIFVKGRLVNLVVG